MKINVIISYTIISLFCGLCTNKNNRINVSFSNAINSKKVIIKMEVLASIPIVEIYNGQQQFEVPNGYGENEWYFTYDDSLSGYLRHIKTNRNHKHNYYFNFYKVNNKFFVAIKIEGISDVVTKIELK